jgi:hypothetical protein
MFKKHLVIIILFFFNINMLIADASKKHFNTETHKIITKHLPEYKIVGKANYSFLIWNIYDATLVTKSGKFEDDEFVLVLKYNKVIKKERLVNETINEFKKQAEFKEEYLNSLRQIFNKTFKKTKINSVFVGIKGKKQAYLYFEGKEVFKTNDEKFINYFFNIWLREDSQNPSFTKKLLGR